MNINQSTDNEPKYINPYLGGVLLGLLVLITVFVTGRGLGASGAIKSTVVATAKVIMPATVKSNSYMNSVANSEHSPMYTWLVFESIGIFVGGLLSGIIFGRVKKFRIEHSPKISSKTRLWFALGGGMFFGFGSQFGRGCTSGAALCGTATFAFGGVIVLFAIFGTGYAVAYFFRKLWI